MKMGTDGGLEENVIMFFQKYNTEENRQLRYQEFCSAFATIDKNLLKDLALRVPTNMHLTLAFEDMFSPNTI
jgi:hypothetical protein